MAQARILTCSLEIRQRAAVQAIQFNPGGVFQGVWQHSKKRPHEYIDASISVIGTLLTMHPRSMGKLGKLQRTLPPIRRIGWFESPI